MMGWLWRRIAMAYEIARLYAESQRLKKAIERETDQAFSRTAGDARQCGRGT